ncbi:phage protein [Leptospira adleri]|uniref:Uncharacterized protein n=1 Tax=Leptospira adleri TaxID=2023186 RepID=A0A2M9YNU0_9LEPT|nr:hypothetical protein [Leptospira adleri]PJZ53140.1 hypothetical protein CH380_12070 [Leptospira adleri]PJZ62070.1 hypothetical protein CH376_09775 [Leptospira adleri]
MNGNPKLFGRVASLEIFPKGGTAKEFTFPPFDMEFESDLGPLNLTTVTLYNVNEDTMTLVGAKAQGAGFQYPSVFLNAGYKDENGLVASGNVIRPKFKQDGTNRILEFQISANAGTWSRSYIMKTYSKLPAMSVILDVLERGNIKPGKIVLGENKMISLSANTSLGESVKKICDLTKSQYWFQDGLLHIDSFQPKQKRSSIFLDSTSGLIGLPEEGQKNWKVTSLFRHKFKQNMVISIHGGNLNGDCRIVSGKHKFSTFQSENYSELEVLPL